MSQDIDTGIDHLRLLRNVFGLHKTLLDAGNEMGAQYGLHVAELHILNILAQEGALPMGQVAARTLISPSNATHTIKKLEAKKLARRSRSPNSDRVVEVALTEQGRALTARFLPEVIRFVRDIFEARLTDRELETFAKLLAKIET